NLILYSRFETGLALQEVEEYETGQGISDITLGVRLGYALSSVFAPYVGFTWTRALGETADLVEDAGGDEESSAVVAGFKIEL
ncbi:MAG: copper resistance protein B, partial [Desulfovibrionales bacterium]